LASSVEQNLEFIDHFSGVLGSILCICSFSTCSTCYTWRPLTSIALRRADCSQAWPSARAWMFVRNDES
jgi:hypothetical protein